MKNEFVYNKKESNSHRHAIIAWIRQYLIGDTDRSRFDHDAEKYAVRDDIFYDRFETNEVSCHYVGVSCQGGLEIIVYFKKQNTINIIVQRLSDQQMLGLSKLLLTSEIECLIQVPSHNGTFTIYLSWTP